MKRTLLIITAGIFLVGFILGSFLDLSINQSLFQDRNGFGIFMAAFGTAPGYAGLGFFGGLLGGLEIKSKHKTWLKVILWLVAFGCLGVGLYQESKEIFSYNGYNLASSLHWIGYVGALILIGGPFALGVYLGPKVKNDRLWIIIFIMALVALIALFGGVSLLKSLMHRPRYRLLVAGDPTNAHFKNWWERTSNHEVSSLINSEITEEEFKSFPSGHAAGSAMTMMIVAYLPYALPKLKKYQVVMYITAFVWTLLVCFSRMTVGAHYLSDVSMGGLIFIVCFMIGNEIVDKYVPKWNLDKFNK